MRQLRVILIVVSLLALAGGVFALTHIFRTSGYLVQSPETARYQDSQVNDGGRITATSPFIHQFSLSSPPAPADISAYPQSASGAGSYPPGNVVQSPGVMVPAGPLTERSTQIANGIPPTERGNYLPNVAPLTERTGPISPSAPITDQNAHLLPASPPTERSDRVPETTPPIERRISQTPLREPEETPSPRSQAEVANYLRFLKEIETRRQILCREQVGHIQFSGIHHVASTLLAEMSENPELRHRQNYIEFQRSIAAMSRDWQILNRMFTARRAPTPCQTLCARYLHLLQITTHSIGMVVNAFGMAMSGNPQAAITALSRMGGSGLGSASRAVAEACKAAEAELAAVCKRFQLNKDFGIQDQ
jgi:hypothetical protein